LVVAVVVAVVVEVLPVLRMDRVVAMELHPPLVPYRRLVVLEASVVVGMRVGRVARVVVALLSRFREEMDPITNRVAMPQRIQGLGDVVGMEFLVEEVMGTIAHSPPPMGRPTRVEEEEEDTAPTPP
jgi:hypothetical protein